MGVVAGVDFGTLSVRVSIFDSDRGRLGSGIADYPLHRRSDDPDHATQSPRDHERALVEAMQKALRAGGVDGNRIESLAIDTTGSSVIPARSQPSKRGSSPPVPNVHAHVHTPESLLC